MPIYEYKCKKCGVFEAMQGIKESPLRKCPTCKGKVERQMSIGSFILKGSGWYASDYAKKSPSNGNEASEAIKTNGDSSSASNDSSKSSESSKSNDSSKSADSTKSSNESSPKSSKESKQASESKRSSEKA